MIRNSLILILFLAAVAYAQYPIHRDPVLEQGNTYWWLRNLNWHIQSDTVDLASDKTLDTVYLEDKYEDTGYNIFIAGRHKWGLADRDVIEYYATPISDSSFTIVKNSGDTSRIQYITLHN